MQLSIEKQYEEELGSRPVADALERILRGSAGPGLGDEPLPQIATDSAAFFVRRWPESSAGSGARSRYKLHRYCQERGLPVAALAAAGADDSGVPVQVYATPPGATLDRLLTRATPGTVRRSLASGLGGLLARFHDEGLHHGALFAWHVVVAADAAGFWLLGLDQARQRTRGDGLEQRRRARDLAALFATLPLSDFSTSDRWRLLAAYGLSRTERRAMHHRMHQERRRWQRRGLYPVGPWGPEVRSGPARVRMHESVRSWVRSCGASVQDWSNPAGVSCVRERDGRRNLIWDAPMGERWFGKHYRGSDGHAIAPAVREFETHRGLSWLGLPVPCVRLVARGDDGSSVLWTRGVQPGTTLRDHLHGLDPDAAAETRPALHEVALLVRRLHRAGFCHRDLYLDHFLLEDHGGLRRWVLIDLARVEEHPRLSRRARLRDLARMEYSARTCDVSRGERLRALKVYLGSPRRVERRLWRAILARADRIEKRERRHGRFPIRSP